MSERRGVVAFASMTVAVAVAALVPFLRFRDFYLSGDSIAEFLPVSRRIGDLLLDGESHLMDPSMWRGGNMVGEARFGVWNPLGLVLDITMLQLDDLAVAALLITVVYLLLLAVGVYLLAREYGADPWPSVVVGVAAATGGWTLWMDAAWWTPHLASSAFLPLVWLAARRLVRGVCGPIWLLVAGGLCVTVGNPYSVVMVGLVAVAVVVEFGLSGGREHRLPLAALAATMVALGAVALFVYLPFRQTSVVGFREGGVFNDESWAPGAGDLLLASSPTATPWVRNFGRELLGFPGLYLAWFVLPLAPWWRWRELRRRELAGLAMVGGVCLVLTLAPSHVWFFRWPIRLVPYLFLPVLLAAATLISAGVMVDRWRTRAAGSVAIAVGGAYLAWADVPDDLGWHVLAAAGVLAGCAATVLVGRRATAWVGPVMIVATLLVLVVQVQWQPCNDSVRHYGLPSSVSAYESFGGRFSGTTLQLASFDAIPPEFRNGGAAYRDLAVGSSLAIGGVDSVAVYSGIGFNTHDATLCLRFDGAVCAELWDRLWTVPDGSTLALADLLGLETVVVQRSLLDTAAVPEPSGWTRAGVTDHAVVWRARFGRAWPTGRLTEVAGPISVNGDTAVRSHREVVEFDRTGEGPAQLTFARLAWPGYEATVDGRPLQVGGGQAGLLTVAVPNDVDGGRIVVTWTPPYWRPILALLALGLLIGIAAQAVWWHAGRSGRDEPAAVGDASAP